MKTENLLYLGVGLAAGYVVARKALDKQYNAKLEYELQRTKDFYDVRYGVGEKFDAKLVIEHFEDDLVELHVKVDEAENAGSDKAETEIVESVSELMLGEAGQALTNYQNWSPPPVKIASVENVLAEDAPEPELVDEDNPYVAKPYIIDADAFLENDANYEQITLTYYEGDKTLADQSDEVMDTAWTVGHTGFENLTRFGEKSRDKNIVYIRCEQYKQDFEVCRDGRMYKTVVAGLEET